MQDEVKKEDKRGKPINVFGAFFCERCRNLLTPSKASSTNLQFECHQCGFEDVDFASENREDRVLYSKDYKNGTTLFI